jgi:very-short-patch-repair endonuclease
MEKTLKRYNIEIIKEHNQLFVECKLLENLLELSNIHVSINAFSPDEKCSLKRKDISGRFQQMIYLTEKGFLKLICSSRKPKAVLIANELNLNVTHKYVVPETTFIMNIKQAFEGENMITQYQVDKYNIDLYFPKYKLAIEFDEFKHKFTQKQDKLRQDYIISKLNCRFERIKEGENIFISINRIFKIIINKSL